MKILGLDTSCDDTSAAVVEDGRTVLSSVTHSQVKIHHPYGGVVPELASRGHIRNIVPVVESALNTAGTGLEDLQGVAVTIGPGLIGSLLVGLYYAKSVAYTKRIPMVGVNHLEGHILSIFLEESAPAFPFMALTVSGGHTSLSHVEGYGKYRLMGQTLDDAAGEAFDKVAKMLGLGYPGGPVIERLAKTGRGDRIRFPRAYLAPGSLDFSFSGIKTAVALFIRRWRESGGGSPGGETIDAADITASFQEAIIEVLVEKTIQAALRTGVESISLGGGVACNKALRERLGKRALENRLRVYFPRPAYCMDNGAMIALAGYHRLLKGQRTALSADVRSRFPIEQLNSGN